MLVLVKVSVVTGAALCVGTDGNAATLESSLCRLLRVDGPALLASQVIVQGADPSCCLAVCAALHLIYSCALIGWQASGLR